MRDWSSVSTARYTPLVQVAVVVNRKVGDQLQCTKCIEGLLGSGSTVKSWGQGHDCDFGCAVPWFAHPACMSRPPSPPYHPVLKIRTLNVLSGTLPTWT